MRPKYELATIVANEWSQIEGKFNAHQLRTLSAIRQCRTSTLGGHVDGCTSCGYLRISYNSCRNRHCPKCQATNRERWVLAREAELLTVPYYHVVFTLPSLLNGLALGQPRILYNCLFRSAWATIKEFSGDPRYLGARAGMIALLHTWGSNLSLHPHLHCIVPGGGVLNGRWIKGRARGKYLFPVVAMSTVFRAKMVSALRRALGKEGIPQSIARQLFSKPWVVYAKRPFAGPKQVINYLGRYTHRAAITNQRILYASEKEVVISYKDYRRAGKWARLSLTPGEFIRRFSQHILPYGYTRIRHYGILSSACKKKTFTILGKRVAKKKHTWQSICVERLNFDPGCCPSCGKKAMITISVFDRGPPNIDALKKRIQRKTAGITS